MTAPTLPDKTAGERFAQAIAYEVLAIGLATPLFAWLMGTPWFEMGALTAANCALALAWNVVFNAAFDRVLRGCGQALGHRLRLLHALLFEGGLMLLSLPLAAWWLGIGLGAALAFEAGLLLFFLPYTYLYHWGWDAARAAWLARRAGAGIEPCRAGRRS